ncbi:MAG: flgL [Clostridia bacterium]|jgi:flagellar hook-associated protein 3 FlgL|nr:flgL [Clostridia bacterium]
MRITNGMMLNSMMRNMGRNLNKMQKYEENLATGKRFLTPSDDPIGVSRSLRLNTEVANMEQFKRNTEDAQSWLDTTEVAISNLVEVFQRAKELTMQAATGTNSINERQAIAGEITQLRDQIINIGNTTYAGSYIFSGFKTDKPLFDTTGKYYLKNDAADPSQTLKTNEIIEFNVGISERMGINFLPQRIFGNMNGGTMDGAINAASDITTGDTPQMISIFNQLITDLNDNSETGIKNAISRLDRHFNNVNAIRAEIGVKTNRLELTLNRIDDDTINLKGLLSKNEDADMSEVIMNLKMMENVYQASLSGGARIIQPSLMDFLR